MLPSAGDPSSQAIAPFITSQTLPPIVSHVDRIVMFFRFYELCPEAIQYNFKIKLNIDNWDCARQGRTMMQALEWFGKQTPKW